MFSLEDGREYLFQWDSNRRVLVEDPTITEVHFCNKTDECSLVVKTYTDDTYDGKVYADIPNILLQTDFPIRVYAFCECYTKVEKIFKVKTRTRPADYVYTETEVLQYSNIDARMTVLEDNLVGEVDALVQDRMADYYNKSEVETLMAQVEDLIPTDQEIAEAIPAEYVTEDELLAKQYLVDEDVAKVFILNPAEITVTDLITEAPQTFTDCMEHYISKPDKTVIYFVTDAKGYAPVTITEYASGYMMSALMSVMNRPSIETELRFNELQIWIYKVSTKWNVKKSVIDARTYTEDYIRDNYVLSTVAASVFASKSDLNRKADTVHTHTTADITDWEAPTVNLDNYYTQEQTDTAIQNAISGYATETYVTDALADARETFFLDFTSVTTEEQPATENMIAFAEKWAETPEVCVRIKEQAADNRYCGAAIGGFKTSINITPTDIRPAQIAGNHQQVYHTYTIKKSNDAWVYYGTAGTPFTLATKEYVDSVVSGGSGGGGGSADLSNYYTKTEVDALIPDVSQYQTEDQVKALIDAELGVILNDTY